MRPYFCARLFMARHAGLFSALAGFISLLLTISIAHLLVAIVALLLLLLAVGTLFRPLLFLISHRTHLHHGRRPGAPRLVEPKRFTATAVPVFCDEAMPLFRHPSPFGV